MFHLQILEGQEKERQRMRMGILISESDSMRVSSFISVVYSAQDFKGSQFPDSECESQVTIQS